MLWKHVTICALSVFILGCVAQWEGAPQWEDVINKAHKDMLYRSARATHSYYDCPDSPGNVEPPDQCRADERWGPCGCYEPPYWPFDPIEIFVDVGYVVGRSMEIWGGAPIRKYINMFLGVPYARVPLHERRFKPPEDPMEGWEEGVQKWRADYYRDACPQELWHYQDEFYEPRNFSENCLHMNIFMPNFTGDHPPEKYYEVMVFVHGEDYAAGDAMMYPGHLLAKKEIVVITFNYRLGAFGFLSTMDEYSPGNYGLMDIVQVLKWVQKYIERFHGKKDEVTLVGHGSGAAAIALLLLSPKAEWNGRPLFHQVILMSGSDLCEWSFVDNLYIDPYHRSDPLEFAKDLGRNVGCDPDYGNFDTERMVECLRAKHFDEIVNGSAAISKKYGMMWGPFGPTVDGVGGYLPRTPTEIRQEGNFMKVPMIAGVCKDEGAYLAENSSHGVVGVRMTDGLDPVAFRQILEKIIRPRASIKNQDEVVGSMEFEYTFWAKPDNKTAVTQNLVDLHSDWVWGSCIDAVVKSHMAYDAPVYMYEFAHRSEYEFLPLYMGTPHGRDLDYLFGHPFYNETLGNITNVVPEQLEWTVIDRNISDFMQQMWVNFTKYGVPTTEWTRNVTWYPLHQYNLSYLHIDEWSYMDINYRQSHYAYWREYFPSLSARYAITTTAFPTPEPLVQYQIATYSLLGVAIITIFIIAALGITLWRKTRSAKDYY